MKSSVLLVLASSLALPGCTMGPSSVTTDRFEYGVALADSWKQQVLLNIIKLRYLDTPVFLDVGQIVAGYSLESQATLLGSFATPSTVTPSRSLALGAGVRYTDRPTITYTPLTGPAFVKGLMTPIPPTSILFIIQSGFSADFTLQLTVDSCNNVRNRSASPARMHPGDPKFFALTAALGRVQRAGGLGARVEVGPDKKETSVVFFSTKAPTPEVAADIAEVKSILGVKPEATSFRVIYGQKDPDGENVGMLTRSMLHIMIELCSTVEVPEEHLRSGRAVAMDPPPAEWRLMSIHSGPSKPADSTIAVPYRNLWFWVDDGDLVSKRTFSSLLLLFTLADVGPKATPPVVTISTQ